MEIEELTKEEFDKYYFNCQYCGQIVQKDNEDAHNRRLFKDRVCWRNECRYKAGHKEAKSPEEWVDFEKELVDMRSQD